MRRLPVLAALVLAVVAAGCGTRATNSGVTVADGVDGRALLAAAPAATRNAGTAHVSLVMELAGPGIPDGTTVNGVGQMDFTAGMTSLTVDMSSIQPQLGSMQYLMTPDAMYMSYPLLEQMTGSRWLRMRFADLGEEYGVDFQQMMSGQATDPGAMLDQLYGVTDDVEVVGEELVRGASTTHYRATVDQQAILEQAPDDSREAVANLLEMAEMEQGYAIDVWIDDDGLVRRQAMTMSMIGVDQTATIDWYDYGIEVDIQVPRESIIDLPEFMDLLGDPATRRVPG